MGNLTVAEQRALDALVAWREARRAYHAECERVAGGVSIAEYGATLDKAASTDERFVAAMRATWKTEPDMLTAADALVAEREKQAAPTACRCFGAGARCLGCPIHGEDAQAVAS